MCYRNVIGVAIYDDRFGVGTLPILLDDVNCQGNEAALADCPHRAWGQHNCERSEDVSVMCVDRVIITGRLRIYDLQLHIDSQRSLLRL